MSEKLIDLPEDEKRIWGEEGFRVFLSHKSEVKRETAELKEQLKLFGISCFVAHKDIEPTKTWQDEIERALSSMDALVALITEKFHDSVWTNQEVGFALGREVPIVTLKLEERDPCGFIGKFQALTCSWDSASMEVVKILLKHDQMLDTYIKAVRKCQNRTEANKLSELLPFIAKLSDQQARDLISAFNENKHVRNSPGFKGDMPSTDRVGLVSHLNRSTGRPYELIDSGKIEEKSRILGADHW